MFEPLEYLIIATDYATSCAGTCPTCVLTKSERQKTGPASTVENIVNGMRVAAENYMHVDTLAVGIGRANVLSLPENSVSEIVAILENARKLFSHGNVICEVTSSLVGKIETQTQRAKAISNATAAIGIETRFVIVGNTALVSEKYWKNLDYFLTEMEKFRGGKEIDGNGDILQLALSIESLPDPVKLAERIHNYRFPINIAWAPGHDLGAKSEENLKKLNDWLGEFYNISVDLGLDSSIKNRVDAVTSLQIANMPEAVRHVSRSSEAIVYIAQDGTWHNGLFTVLAEMDPVRFDPAGKDKTMAGTAPKELRKLMMNEACVNCSYIGTCVASGGHKIAQMTLRNFTDGTNVCPSGLKACFERSHARLIKGVNIC